MFRCTGIIPFGIPLRDWDVISSVIPDSGVAGEILDVFKLDAWDHVFHDYALVFHDYILLRFRRKHGRITMYTVDELVLEAILDVREEVRRSWGYQGVTAENLRRFNLGNIAVVVFAPYFKLEVIDVNPIMT